MRLTKAKVTNFKSISDSGEVSIDPTVTVLVGQNEAGKTAFLAALHRARPADDTVTYDVTMDYPRRYLSDYEERHEGEPAQVATLEYEISDAEAAAIDAKYGAAVMVTRRVVVTHSYDGSTVTFTADDRAFLQHLVEDADLPVEAVAAVTGATSVRAALTALEAIDRNAEAESFHTTLKTRFARMAGGWRGVAWEIWTTHLAPRIPRFVYFDDFRLLPGRTNLAELQGRVQQNSPKVLTDQDRAVLGLLRMAKVDLPELVTTTSYEHIKAKLEAFSNSITDRVFAYWKQTNELDVEIDLRAVPTERAPFNNGPNLYIRIRHRRHRSTISFDQRSRGFIWFFSFLVWFDSVKQQIGTDKDLILLLDEPGLSLHALAQADFLRYIDDLAKKHQTIYTTHSPFMVHSDRLHQVRLVEDRVESGTVVSDDVTGSDPKTVFPLQAALGYTIAQNLFISPRNLLVEGPSDLIYLQQASAALEAADRTSLRDDVTIVPAGGLDNVATFVALLGGNQLETVVLHDLGTTPHQRLEGLTRGKVIREKHVVNFGMFRDAAATPPKGTKGAAVPAPVRSTDVEDLLSPAMYLDLFSRAFAKGLGGRKLAEADLPPGDRITDRITRFLADEEFVLRPSGGFNHYTVATYLAGNPPKKWDKDSLARFEALFGAVNRLFSAAER